MAKKGNKVIELWKGDCDECQMVSSTIKKLQKDGYNFQQHNIADGRGRKYWDEFANEIDVFSKKKGWEEGYIYTPTFIRPDTRKILAVQNNIPSQDELVEFATVY